MTHDRAKRRIRELNEWLREELAAASTCEHALTVEDLSPEARERIENLCASHRQRVNELRAEVLLLGGDPEDGFGAWSRLRRLLALGATREALSRIVHFDVVRSSSLAANTFGVLREIFSPAEHALDAAE
jgi:hypothetical protein